MLTSTILSILDVLHHTGFTIYCLCPSENHDIVKTFVYVLSKLPENLTAFMWQQLPFLWCQCYRYGKYQNESEEKKSELMGEGGGVEPLQDLSFWKLPDCFSDLYFFFPVDKQSLGIISAAWIKSITLDWLDTMYWIFKPIWVLSVCCYWFLCFDRK